MDSRYRNVGQPLWRVVDSDGVSKVRAAAEELSEDAGDGICSSKRQHIASERASITESSGKTENGGLRGIVRPRELDQ